LVIFDFATLLRGESADRGVHPRRAAQQMIYYVATLRTVLAAAPKKDCCCSKRLRPATEHQHGGFCSERNFAVTVYNFAEGYQRHQSQIAATAAGPK